MTDQEDEETPVVRRKSRPQPQESESEEESLIKQRANKKRRYTEYAEDLDEEEKAIAREGENGEAKRKGPKPSNSKQ